MIALKTAHGWIIYFDAKIIMTVSELVWELVYYQLIDSIF